MLPLLLKMLLTLNGVLLKHLKNEFPVLVEIPGYGNTHNFLVCSVHDALLQFLLQVLGAIDLWQAFENCSIVLHGIVLVIPGLHQSELPHAVQERANEREHVDHHQEAHLGPHQLLLLLVAPCHEDAVLPRRAEPPRAEDEERGVDQRGERDPGAPDQGGPDDDGHLEVEVYHHAGPGNCLAQEVRAQRPHPPAISLVHAELLPGAELQG
mmetsp:Transcript_129501/g.360761  ORF Transcript_129501/g.360761 Transcript_129501/m.360761 type:complete len:210 (+) Transcript_129501:1865-2494(+)